MQPLEIAHTLLARSDEFAHRAEQAKYPDDRDAYARGSNAAVQFAASYAAVAQAEALARIADALEKVAGAINVVATDYLAERMQISKPAKPRGRSGPRRKTPPADPPVDE